jgi:lipopolysaccharide biosynthesis glycosyltransferase
LTQKPIHIALTFDDNFWAPAYATMRGVCLSTKRRADLVFHLCHRTLTPTHKADLQKISDEFGSTLTFYNIDEMALFHDIAARARYNKRLSNIVYARLMFDRILPDDIDRLIYLDCDIYVRAPIENLAERDMKGFPIAAVQDYLALFITGGRDIKNNRDLFDPADPYFNAGVLLIDMKAWRKADIVAQLEIVIANGIMDRIYYDQDFLNLIFKNNWLHLEQLWNTIDPRPPHQALNPHVLHYTDKRKPWNLISGVAFARHYRHVMTNELYYRYMRHRIKRRILKFIGRTTSPKQNNSHA